MNDELEKLSDNDRKLLLKAPALVSLFAAGSDGVLDDAERSQAVDLSNMRTFTSEPELRTYYKAAAEVFDEVLDKYTDADDRIGEEEKRTIQLELDKLGDVLKKMDKNAASKLQDSLRSYADHVSRSHSNIIFRAMFPLDVPGLTDK